MLYKFDHFPVKNAIIAGDFNLFFNPILEPHGRNPILQKHSICNIFKLKETFDLCAVWRVRNPNAESFTFRQKHFSGIIQRSLNYLFTSNDLQDSVDKTYILNAFQTDHSAVCCIFANNISVLKGQNFWKFSNSLIYDATFIEQIKSFILVKNNSLSGQSKLEY